jgi:hypothetical protein
MAMSEQTDTPQMSQQALIVYKALYDQIDFIKKQQWVTTNYLVLIYAAIAWVGQHITPTPWVLCTLSTITAVAGVLAIVLLVLFQRDLSESRGRMTDVETAIFSSRWRDALRVQPYQHTYGRGWLILVVLILVCIVGAFLVILALCLSQRATAQPLIAGDFGPVRVLS